MRAVNLHRLVGRFWREVDLTDQVRAFRRAFGSVDGKKLILPALGEFCGVGLPLPTDPSQLLRQAGRQDVWLYIQQHLQLDPEHLYALLQGKLAVRPEDID